jgi:hypothetical protein
MWSEGATVSLEGFMGQSAPHDQRRPKETALARFQEAHYTVAEVAEMWKLSADTVRKVFENEPGVLVIGTAGGRGKGGYRTLRIPESIVERVHRRLCNPDLTPVRVRAYPSGSRDHQLLTTTDGP